VLSYSRVYCEWICEGCEIIVICCVGLQQYKLRFISEVWKFNVICYIGLHLCLLWVYLWSLRIDCNLLRGFTAAFIVSEFLKIENWLYFVMMVYSCVYCECICEDWEFFVIPCFVLELCWLWVYLWKVRIECNFYVDL